MKTTEAVIGKWQSVLPMLGVSPDYLTGKHTQCPICLNGKDKFRFDDKQGRGTYFCNDCGAGDGFKLLSELHGWEFKKSACEIDKVIGNAQSRPIIKKDDDIEKKRTRLNQLRQRVEPFENASRVIDYLTGRGISMATLAGVSGNIGYVRDLEYWNDGKLLGRYDAMAATVINSGKPVTYHTTYLDNGQKANVPVNRKILSPVSSISGGAVPMFKHKGILGIAEGIETALAATQLYEVPTWAALNANNLASFEIPADVKHLVIFGDNDASYTGQKAAFTLAWQANRNGIKATVHIPPTVNTDWCDVLRDGV